MTARLSRWALVLFGVDCLLSLGAFARHLYGRPIVVVPGVDGRRVVRPREVPEPAVANFARLFTLELENYTHLTLEPQKRFLAPLVSSRFATQIERILYERAQMSKESRFASSLNIRTETVTVTRHADDLFEVRFRGTKRNIIADRVSWEASFEYTVLVEVGTPSHLNPYALFVAGHSARQVKDEDD